jgi:hypothetical protein
MKLMNEMLELKKQLGLAEPFNYEGRVKIMWEANRLLEAENKALKARLGENTGESQPE